MPELTGMVRKEISEPGKRRRRSRDTMRERSSDFEVFPLNSNVCNFLIEVTFTGEYLRPRSVHSSENCVLKLLTKLAA